MKTFLKLLVIAAIAALAIVFAQPTQGAIFTSRAVQIPLELSAAINGAVLFLVMFGLQWVADHLHINLTGWGVAIALEISEFVILQLQGLIDLVPAQYDFWVSFGLFVLLAALTALGFAQVAFRRTRAMQLFGTDY